MVPCARGLQGPVAPAADRGLRRRDGLDGATDLPTGAARTARDLEVAVSPAGRTLLAWATGRGIQAALDGEAAATLTAEPDAGSPAPAVAAGNTARRSRVVRVRR